MNSRGPVLITWVAVNNDPFERDGQTGEARLVDGERVPGPTLNLLSDNASPYANKVKDVVLLYRYVPGGDTQREEQAVNALSDILRQRQFTVFLHPWQGDDPTDHLSIFEFMREKIPQLRQRFTGRELILHISPGTPSMHTVWLLMAETGFIKQPFVVVKSYRRSERRGRQAVVPVVLGIETFYKAYIGSRPRQVSSEEQGVVWDPSCFKTAAMKRVYDDARRFAQLKVPILIRGERGTGKTTLASWIRSNSPFKRSELDTRWPSVACGQYNTETMRTELFGCKKGAFTDAIDKEGLLAVAHRDTLFLDEVGDVSHDLQRLLIKAIEEKRYFALGDDKPRESDFRLLTATNIDEIELKRRLNPDFLDRISLLTLVLPPLRDVRDELPWVWEAVYSEATRRAGFTKRSASLAPTHHSRAVEFLRQHPLPGNLRDLFRVAYRMLAARVDEPMSPEETVAYGLEALKDNSSDTDDGVAPSLGAPKDSSGDTIPKTLAKLLAEAFSRDACIDDLLPDTQSLQTEEVIKEFQAFIASEVRRLAKNRGVAPASICDVTDRTLRNWETPTSKVRKNPS